MQADHRPYSKAEPNEDPRFYFRRILVAIGLFFFIGICFIIEGTQKDQSILQEMRRNVESVRQFQIKEGRLPTFDEVRKLADHGYAIFTKSGTSGDERLNRPFPEDGWALTRWRGESWDIYTSWDDHYTLEEQDEVWEIVKFDSFWKSLTCIVIVIVVYRKWGHPRKVGVTTANEPQIQKIP